MSKSPVLCAVWPELPALVSWRVSDEYVSCTAVAASFVCSQSFHFSLAAKSSLLWLTQPLGPQGLQSLWSQGHPRDLEGDQEQQGLPGCAPQGVDPVSSYLWRL